VHILRRSGEASVKVEERKVRITSLNELSRDYADVGQVIKRTATESAGARQLWRQRRKPILIKAGLALIAFPDPTITDIVGSALVVAGLVQEGIRRRTLYVEDVQKTFLRTMKEIRGARDPI
jgi:hypothetical protein